MSYMLEVVISQRQSFLGEPNYVVCDDLQHWQSLSRRRKGSLSQACVDSTDGKSHSVMCKTRWALDLL